MFFISWVMNRSSCSAGKSIDRVDSLAIKFGLEIHAAKNSRRKRVELKVSPGLSVARGGVRFGSAAGTSLFVHVEPRAMHDVAFSRVVLTATGRSTACRRRCWWLFRLLRFARNAKIGRIGVYFFIFMYNHVSFELVIQYVREP